MKYNGTRIAGRAPAPRNPITRANATRQSTPTLAIAAYCYRCQGGREADKRTLLDLRREVRDCGTRRCALWSVRPYRSPDRIEEDLRIAGSRDERGWSASEEHPARPALLQRALERPANRRAAVEANCWLCRGAGDDGERETKLVIRDCRSRQCHLWPYRPFRHLKDAPEDLPEPSESATTPVDLEAT